MKLSICIPTYNRAKKLDNILRQLSAVWKKYKSLIEVIVFDNGSTDETRLIISKYPWIKKKHHKYNLGFAANFDKLLKAAVGEFVLFLADDDLLYPLELESFIEELLNLKEKPNFIIMKYGIKTQNQETPTLSHLDYLEDNDLFNYTSYMISDLKNNYYKPFVFLSGFVFNRLDLSKKELESKTNYPQLETALENFSSKSKFYYTNIRFVDWIEPALNSFSEFRLMEDSMLLERQKLDLLNKYAKKFYRQSIFLEPLHYFSFIYRVLKNRDKQIRNKFLIISEVLKEKTKLKVFFWILLTPLIILFKKINYGK